MLRCARCGHSFRAALPEPPADAPAPGPAPRLRPESRINAPAGPTAGAVAPEVLPPPPMSPPPPPPSRTPPPPPGAAAEDRLGHAPTSPPDRFAVAGWVLTVLVLGLAAYAGYAFRAEIMAAWPPAQRLYALLGLA